MTYAKAKILIHDDLLRPSPIVSLEFNGPNPDKFYHEIPNLVESILKVGDTDLHERKFSWTKGDPEKFEVIWEIDKELDKFTYYWFIITFRVSSSKGSGKATILIDGALRTEYPQENHWQKSLVYEFFRVLWHHTIYAPTRKRYHDEGRRLMSILVQHLKKMARE